MKLFGLHLYRQALHETIRASLGLPNFCLSFFQTCISHHGCEKSQIYGKLQFLEDLLATQNIDSSYFYSYITPPPPLPHIATANSPTGSIITSQATMTLNIRLFLFYMICNFFKCDDFTLL